MAESFEERFIQSNRCPVCDLPLSSKPEAKYYNDYFVVDCFRCGMYKITETAIQNLPQDRGHKEAISAHIHRNQKIYIKYDDLPGLLRLPILTPPEKSDLLLLDFSKKYPIPGTKIPIIWRGYGRINDFRNNSELEATISKVVPNFKSILDSLAICQILDQKELMYITDTYLLKHKKYLEPNGTDYWKITPDGWEHIYSLVSANRESQAGFIAMRFLPELTKFSDDFIASGIIDAGYQPLRVDKNLSTDLIDDTIVASIRRSKFVVADLTENSYGVYYEAGFARGLGLPVIYTCNEEYFNNKGIHFDVNHYPVLKWTYNQGTLIQKAVQMRIEANVGRGAYNPKTH
jgi:hypothetical protein